MTKTHLITLIGMSGSGKSTVGQALADKLGVAFYDSDSLITLETGLTPREIFAQSGESAFRQLERETILRLIAEKVEGVISTGGGAVMQDAVAEAVFAQTTSIWLDVAEPLLWARQEATLGTRPMLSGDDPRQKMAQLLEARRPVYARADIVVAAGTRTPGEIAAAIEKKLSERTGGA